MFRHILGAGALAALCIATLVPEASAFGRRTRHAQTCPCPCPCPPAHPNFSLHAGIENGPTVPWSPDRTVPLKVEIGVTDLEPYAWTYTNAEYGFYLFDQHGRQVPSAFLVTTELRTITVVPRATVLDSPGVSVAAGVLQLGKTYTVVVTLRGRAACFPIVPVIFGGPTGKGERAAVEVVGKSGGAGPRWESQGMASGKAAVGKPENRLVVKVKNGDVVRFTVASGSHGVLFEKAKAEQAGGVWEVVTDSGDLKELPGTAGFDRFDRQNARTTDAKGAGSTLIEIRVKNLKPGAENGVLFACNPHSAMGDATMTTMLGVIVLTDE